MADHPETKKMNPDDEVHQVDGIVELNHPAPFWWQAIYYISIIWAIAYSAYYLTGNGTTIRENLVAELAAIENGKTVPLVSLGDEEKELRSSFSDSVRLAEGKAVYVKNCLSCHADDGGGGIGPNLTDRSWIHGDGSLVEIMKLVRNGVSDKGMPPWGPLLKREETIYVSAYVRSLRDRAPAKPKSPQGTLVTYSKDD